MWCRWICAIGETTRLPATVDGTGVRVLRTGGMFRVSVERCELADQRVESEQ
jgi:hypothetical protein